MDQTPLFTNEKLEQGRKFFCRPCHFVLGVAHLHQLPEDSLSEVAFVGRSNVGKSSLINALFKRKDLAKTSSTPGRTQQLNYFNLDDQMYLVDLPGYGFAKAPPADVKKWQDMIFTYLQGRVSLRRVFLLVDSRHGLKQVDLDAMKLLDKAAVPYQIVLTKTDKISEKELQKVIAETQKIVSSHAAALNLILTTSSEKQIGIENVRAEIAEIPLG